MVTGTQNLGHTSAVFVAREQKREARYLETPLGYPSWFRNIEGSGVSILEIKIGNVPLGGPRTAPRSLSALPPPRVLN